MGEYNTEQVLEMLGVGRTWLYMLRARANVKPNQLIEGRTAVNYYSDEDVAALRAAKGRREA